MRRSHRPEKRRVVAHRNREAKPRDWDAQYRRGDMAWRSSGLGQTACGYLAKYVRGKSVLEVGCGPGDDGEDFIQLGYHYEGVDFSPEAIALAAARLRPLGGRLLAADFFSWRPDRSYSAVYDKGVFHCLRGAARRRSFALRVAAALERDGIWLTICGAAPAQPLTAPQGAIFLTHLIEKVEPYFDVLEVVKAPFGVKRPACDFDAWHCAFRRR